GFEHRWRLSGIESGHATLLRVLRRRVHHWQLVVRWTGGRCHEQACDNRLHGRNGPADWGRLGAVRTRSCATAVERSGLCGVPVKLGVLEWLVPSADRSSASPIPSRSYTAAVESPGLRRMSVGLGLSSRLVPAVV